MIRKIFSSQQGAALVAGMLILVALTLLGVAGITLTSIDTQISKNYRTSVQAVELANAAVAQMIFWFNNPSSFTDTSVGSYRTGTNSDQKGSNFFAQRRTVGIAKSFFTSNRSQFYDVNGDNVTLASESSPALEYDAGTAAQKTWLDNTFSQLSDVGNITNLKVWGTSNREEVGTARIEAESKGGGKATIEVVYKPSPAPGIANGLEIGGSGSFAGKSAKVHWSNAMVVGNIGESGTPGDYWNWSSDNPAQRTTGTTTGDAPDNKTYGSGSGKRENDPWLKVYVGGTLSLNNDTNAGDCDNDATYNRNSSNQYISDNTDTSLTVAACNSVHTNVYPGQNNDADTSNNVALNKLDYDTSKSYAKINTVSKGGTTYPGYYYTKSGSSNKDKIWDLSGTQYSFSSQINGITDGFVFIDSTNQQVPDYDGVGSNCTDRFTNLQELSVSGSVYIKGNFYIAGCVSLSGAGSTTNINVQSPPWDSALTHGETDGPGSCTDSSFRQSVSNLPVHLNGFMYVAGEVDLTGNLQIFGALISEKGFTGAGTPEIWYDYGLRDGPDNVSPVSTKSWREVREQQ